MERYGSAFGRPALPPGGVNGEGQALAEPESTDVNEFDGRAVPAQPDVIDQIVDLLAGEDGRKSFVIFDTNLGEDGHNQSGRADRQKRTGWPPGPDEWTWASNAS